MNAKKPAAAGSTIQSILGAVAQAHVTLSGAPRAAASVVDPEGNVLGTWGQQASDLTLFRIASMTKSFTAALVLLLRDEGVLDLDRPVSSIASELSGLTGPGIDPAPITLRHLLTMSSGLATDDPWADRHLDATDAQLDEWIANGLRFAFPTGVAFEYSNLGYALIGRVVHRATGHRLQMLVRNRLIVPLGMTNTLWSTEDLPTSADVADGVHPVGDQLIIEPRVGDGVIAPMGGLWSCAADMCRWMAFLSSAFGDRPITGPLDPRSRREMQQLQRGLGLRRSYSADGSQRMAEGGYAMGLTTFHDDRFGSIVTHSGGLPGYGSNMRWIAGGVGVVILANITYARMMDAGAAVLDALAFAEVASLKGAAPAEALVDAASRLASLLRSWGYSAANDLFADNVPADRPFSIREQEAIERFGPARDANVVTVVDLVPHGNAAATVTLLASGHLTRVRIELAPTAPTVIQKYEFLPS